MVVGSQESVGESIAGPLLTGISTASSGANADSNPTKKLTNISMGASREVQTLCQVCFGSLLGRL